MIVRIGRFVAWELRRRRERRKLPPEVLAQLRRLEKKPHAISCPICGEKFPNLGSGRGFRWHILGHEGD